MKVEQLYTGCLAEAAYYIESKGEVAIIDPLRETEPYIRKATENGAKIKYVLETHFHADFVSGHLDLARKTGATIVYGPNARADFDIHVAVDGEELQLGDVRIKVLHTPGHTMESSTFLLKDEAGKDYCIFTGDTLFIGDVGRPDLAVKTDLTREDLAGHLFDSLRNKILPLADDVIVYPGHGAGSACGKNLSKETFATLGSQKQTNYALRSDMSRDEFIQEVTHGLTPPPQYFPKNAIMNKMGYDNFEEILTKGSVPLDAAMFKAIAEHEGALVLDTRHHDEFAKAHIPGSIFIGIDGSFAPWVGALITDLEQAIIFLAPEGREEEVVMRLSRVGYDNTLGYLKGGIQTWIDAGNETDSVQVISAQELAQLLKREPLHIVDVRKPGEYVSEHVLGASNFPLDYINDQMGEWREEQRHYIHCAGGYRSMIACSILKSRGIHDIVDIKGGFGAIKENHIPVSEYICPTTLA